MAIRPIFVFSVSRSGSTLVQRVIAAHDGVATVAEPWLLVPYAYTLRARGVRAEYFHPLLVTAIGDFTRTLPRGVEDYRLETRAYALRLYEKAAAPGARYFLDKSPVYYLVADEIMRLFPEGKFVFLWRNPLSIMASIIETFEAGRWSPTACRSDVIVGLPRLVSTYMRNRSIAHAVRFEELVDGGDAWAALMEYLGIEFDAEALRRFSEVELEGSMGDPTGVEQYGTLSREPEHKWRATLANPLRKAWCRRCLHLLGDERLAAMGYDAGRLVQELDSEPTTSASLASDLCRLVVDLAKEPVRVRMRAGELGGPNMIRELLAA